MRATSFRFTDRTREIIREIAEDLHISDATALTLAITSLHRQLGYKARDSIAAVESITRVYGDDVPVVVTLTEPPTAASITFGGKDADEDWEAWVQTGGVGNDGEPIGAAAFYARWQPKRVTFALGEVEEAETGSKITVRPRDLVDLVLLRSEADESKSPAQRRADLRAEFEARREIDRMLGEAGYEGIAGGDRPDE
jgi:hypothetical protein